MLFRGQESEAIRQLKSILKHPNVSSLPNEAPLPDEAMDAIKKVIEDANNVDAQSQVILDSLRPGLPSVAADAGAISSSSSSSSSGVAAAPEGFPYFQGVPRLLMECLFDWLPPKDQFRFFVALGKTKNEAYKQAREAAVESVSQYFLRLVADAKMEEAEEMLKFVEFNPAMLRQLLTTNRACTHLCEMPIRGTALEIAEKCWDTAINKQEAMAEMIMRYMRKLKESAQDREPHRRPLTKRRRIN